VVDARRLRTGRHHGRPGRNRRRDRQPVHRARPRRVTRRPAVGHQRLSAGPRRSVDPRGLARRPLRAAPDVPDRCRRLRGGVACRRALWEYRRDHRVPRPAGRRRRANHAEHSRPTAPGISAGEAQLGDRYLGRRHRRSHRRGPDPRGRAPGALRLVQRLLHQHPDRCRRARRRHAGAAREPRGHRRPARLRRSRQPRDRAVPAGLRRYQGADLGLGRCPLDRLHRRLPRGSPGSSWSRTGCRTRCARWRSSATARSRSARSPCC